MPFNELSDRALSQLARDIVRLCIAEGARTRLPVRFSHVRPWTEQNECCGHWEDVRVSEVPDKRQGQVSTSRITAYDDALWRYAACPDEMDVSCQAIDNWRRRYLSD